ncbi:hypothetical protein PHMEG_000430 [Phytophthora megakarya]|uniref:Uncharacterized protein n=1 Tax=Phytophthora megakarya TaxID=4795 RepID=A0A225X5K4_9STRA|nr:hypothetical protein PHMEG_000430 [Phytophthora megakarya]
MAKGSSYAVPATPSRGEHQTDYDSTPGTEDLVTTGRSVSFEDTEFGHDAKDEDDYVDDELEEKAPYRSPTSMKMQMQLAWQIRELTAMEEMDPTPRFEIAQHRPLGKITPFRGKLDERENSVQWLRCFVALSRKTKRTCEIELCASVRLSDKLISYYCSQFSQSASTRYYRAKQSEKEHIRDYLNRLNGYARSSNIKFERSGREAKEHVKQFLETCGDRDLERQLSPMQLRNIHTLEDIVSDIQKVEKRVSGRSSSQSSSRRDDYSNDYSNAYPIEFYEGDEADQDMIVIQRTRSKQVHEFGKCEAFDELANILRINVDKTNISPELQKLVFNNNNNDENDEKKVEFDGECGVCHDGGTLHEIKEDTTTKNVVNDDWLVSICEANGGRHREFWVMDHSVGSEVVLGTDFMIPAGIRLDLFNATTKLPGEEMVPLVKSLSADEDSAEGMHVTGGPTKSLQIPAGEWIEFRLQKRKQSFGTHDVWVRRTAALIPTIIQFRKGQPTLQTGYALIDARKYEQWQVLAYTGSHDETWFKLEYFTLTTTRTKFEAGRQASSELNPSKVVFLFHEVSPEGIGADPKKMIAITELQFPKSKKGMHQFLGPLNYYSRFFQDFAVYGAALYQLKEDDFFEGSDLATAKENFTALRRKVAEAPILRHFDAKKGVHIMLYANAWALSANLTQMHDDKLHPVRFADEFVTLNWTRLDPSLLYAQLPHDYEEFVVSFDGSAKTEKNGGYGSCSWIVWKLPEWQIVIATSAYLEQTTVNMAEYSGMNHGVIAALEHGAEVLVIVGDSRLAIQQSLGVIACRKVREYNVAADSLAGEALESKVSKVALNDHRKTELKELNRIQEMIYEPSSDDIKAENTSSETFAQIIDGKTRRIHAMDSDILLQRNTFVDFVHQESTEVSATARSQTKTKNKRVHFEDEVPKGTTNTEATEAATEDSAMQEQRPSAEVRYEPTADDTDPVTVQEERRRRITQTQDEELRWSKPKDILRGETTAMIYKEAREAWKWADNFVLSSDKVLYYTGLSRRKVDENSPEMSLRLVVPTTMIQEVLHNCHDSIEGGHQCVVRSYQRVKHDYYWIGLYADVEKHVELCLDCRSSKSLPQFKGYSPGNVLAERPFQCSFTGFMIAKAMSDTDALTVAKVFQECIYRRFGAPSLIRHDRDPRCTSEVFQAFAKLIQARSRSTLSYRPQANGQQERSVKTVMQSVKQQITLEMAKEYQAAEKTRRTRIHNQKLGRKEQAAIPKSVNDDSSGDYSDPKCLFRPGSRVWLYMERAKPELVKKLAHRWQGPFCVKRKVEEFAYELELPDKSRYRFYPVVYVSRLKAVNEFFNRPKARLARDVAEEARVDFAEELLPEDSWEPDEVAGEFEVEAILSDRTPMSISTDRPVREFEMKWVGYESTTREPASNLSCGRILYDYLRNKKSEQRLQMVQVADED